MPVGDEFETMLRLCHAPVARHLAAARSWGHWPRQRRVQQHLRGGHAQLETERAIAVVRVEPIVRTARRRNPAAVEDCFVPGAGDLEEDLVLSFELDFLVVQTGATGAWCGTRLRADRARGRKYSYVRPASLSP